MVKNMKCRFCRNDVSVKFADLGTSPPSNDYLTATELDSYEKHYPLKVYVCTSCFLVQTKDFSKADELFRSDYAYFSSVSTTLLNHSKEYVDMVVERLNLNSNSFVVEIAANDGYLLKNFLTHKIPCLGIEPTEGTASAAEKLGIKMEKSFFGLDFAKNLIKANPKADLIIGNNVYAHVPDIQDFTAGIEVLLSEDGTVTLEFPHLLNLMINLQFDTIYHEHYSYLSLLTVCKIFESNGLKIYDVEEINTHGGSLRVYGCHSNSMRIVSRNVKSVLEKELDYGLSAENIYGDFQERIEKFKIEILSFLIEAKRANKKVIGFGAAAKSSTLLNFAGIREDLISVICDTSIHKQNKFLPGSRVPIINPEAIKSLAPDYIVIFPWNLKTEIIQQIGYARSWGCKFVTLFPNVEMIN